MEMPFFRTIEIHDNEILESLHSASFSSPRAIPWIPSHPKLVGGISDKDRVAVELLRLESSDPESAAIIWALPWVRDGVTPAETNAALRLQRFSLGSSRVFKVLARKHWIQDGLSKNELFVINELLVLSRKNYKHRDESSALRLLEMPFLNEIDSADASAMHAFRLLHWSGERSYVREVLSHPRLRDGIRDDQTTPIIAIGKTPERALELLDRLPLM